MTTRPTPEIELRTRAERYAALGDPTRLAIVDELSRSDRTPTELCRTLGIASNLLAHHLDALERVELIARTRSHADARRRYVRLEHDTLAALAPGGHASRRAPRALFVCTHNSARSQLAAALWRSIHGASAESAGTEPAEHVHPGAAAAARRAGLDLGAAHPRALHEVRRLPALVVTVCDQAHEELHPDPSWWHWSIPDPVREATPAAFDRVVAQLRTRIESATGGAA